MSFQVVGAGHSATQWLATALTRAGVPCTHEVAYHYQRPSPGPAGDAGDVSWCAAPHLHQVTVPVVRIIRDPLAVVRSICRSRFLRTLNPATLYVRRHRPDITASPSHLDRAIAYAATWCPPTDALRVEDGWQALAELLHRVDHPRSELLLEQVCAELGTTLHRHGDRHAHRDRAITWAQIRSHRHGDRLAEIADQYGYQAA